MTPLAKRLPRELRRNIGKYLGIFLLMCGSIALTSGFLLAAHSIGCLMDDMRDAYTIEDGRVTTSFEATDEQLKAAEDAAEDVGGVTFYKNFSIDASSKRRLATTAPSAPCAPTRIAPRLTLRPTVRARNPRQKTRLPSTAFLPPTTTSPWAIRSSSRVAPTPSAAS